MQNQIDNRLIGQRLRVRILQRHRTQRQGECAGRKDVFVGGQEVEEGVFGVRAGSEGYAEGLAV